MYCPMCRSEFSDGSLKCKECNVRLVVRLPKEKILKKKTQRVNSEKLKYKQRVKILVGAFFATFGIGAMLFLFRFSLFESLRGLQNAILLSDIILKLTFLNIAISTSIGLYFDIDIWNDGKKFNLDSKLLKTLVKRILPIAIISFGIYMFVQPMADYIKKDFQQIQGKVTNINHTKIYDDLYIDGKYFPFNESLFRNIEEGRTYTFIYAKRTKVILNVK